MTHKLDPRKIRDELRKIKCPMYKEDREDCFAVSFNKVFYYKTLYREDEMTIIPFDSCLIYFEPTEQVRFFHGTSCVMVNLNIDQEFQIDEFRLLNWRYKDETEE
jgi:hypothetical protein